MSADSVISDDRALVLMPTGLDAQRTVQLLAEAQIPSFVCADLVQLCRALREGAGLVLTTDEALQADAHGQLAETLRDQPAWSAVPVLVLAREEAGAQLQRSAGERLRNLTVVERPVRMRTLLSMVMSALRARRNQYQVRDALSQRERQATELFDQDEKLRFALAAGGLGAWELDLQTDELTCSDLCKANFGRESDESLTYSELRASIDAQDRSRVFAALDHALATGADYDVEYRVRTPRAELRWVMVRGRAVYDDAGRALRMVGVSLDVTERKRMHEALQQSESELARQAGELRNADRLKDDFLATLAHELRNPLAPIRSGMELLAAAPGHDVAGRTLGIMQRQLGHMVRLIDDLLDVSRITRGKLELKRGRVRLQDIMASALEASRPLIEQGQHTLRTAITDEPLSFDADLTRIAQVVSNLINNSCKYTPAGGVIELSARREDDEAVIAVSDNGIGIPQERLEDVFTMFSQVNRALDRSQAGLGIGLALVRRLVEMHGGRVTAASAGSGRGSTFTVRLPLAQPQVGSDVANDEHDAAHETAQRILVVDDNDDAADLLSQILQQAGHLTTTAHDGPSALAAAREWAPHIVFLDIGLPGMSGYDVARALRSEARFSETSLIALTGWGTLEDQRKAVEAGFDVHLTKPVDTRALHGALERASKRHAQSARAGAH